MPLNILFTTLALILVVAGFTTIIFKGLKQPLVLGYILAGFLAGPHLFLGENFLDSESITLWGEIGVIFLLFGLGLEFSFKKIKKVGGAGSVAAITEALLMMSVGLIVGRVMNWSLTESIFLGGMLSISSTSIVIKAFEDMKMKSMKFTQIVFGVLVIEDIIAILLLVLLTTLAVSKQFDGTQMLYELAKLLTFIFLWFSGGIYLIPTLIRRLKKLLTDEILLIVTLGLCFAMVVIAAKSGFSPALGAFLMGTIIAETDEQERILKIITPLRNLFAAVFFISVGMLVQPTVLVEYWLPIIVISMVVLFIKPMTATIGILFSGQPLKIAMQAGFSLSQIGEFSFIIASLGLSLGVLDATIYPIIVSVSIITTFVTPYIMRMALPLYDKIFRTVPHSWQVVISQYGSGKRTLNHESDWKMIIKSYITRVLIHSIWLSAILVFTLKLITPFATKEFGNTWWVNAIVAMISIAMMAPFIYALTAGRTASNVFKKLWSDTKYSRGPLLTLIIIRFIIGAFFVGVLLASLFRIPLFILLPTVVFILAVTLLSRSVNKYYHQIEARFLKNLNRHSSNKMVIPYSLANEIHTEFFEVVNDSTIVGKSISDIHKKHRTGAQVVTIYRRNQRIDLPRKDEIIYANDKLVMIGNDDQLLSFKNCIENTEFTPPTVIIGQRDLELYQVTLTKNSVILGEKAHVSTLRDKYNFLLVGYQSNTNEFHRPNPTYYFAKGDTVWAVGKKEVINGLM